MPFLQKAHRAPRNQINAKDVTIVADEKTTAKDVKPTFFQKVAKFFKNLPALIARPFKNMWRELKKVTWPSRENLINYTLLVLAFMAFMGVVIGLLDMGSQALIKLFVSM